MSHKMLPSPPLPLATQVPVTSRDREFSRQSPLAAEVEQPYQAAIVHNDDAVMPLVTVYTSLAKV